MRFEKVRARFTNHLEDVRNSEDHIKRKWFLRYSIGSTIVVVFIWLGYMGLLIPNTPGPALQEAKVIELQTGAGFADVMKTGVGIMVKDIGRGVSHFVANVRDLFDKKHSIEIPGKENQGEPAR